MPPKKPRGGGGGAPGPKAHQLADLMPPGEVLNDLSKGSWRLGSKLGQGGFGLIYFATAAAGKAGAEPSHVIKQEPAGNGPLALECLFYAGTMKAAKLEAWAKSKRVVDLGLPKYIGWGMHTFKGKNNRFLVMDRFGDDLQKLFVSRGTFSRVVVAQMALRLIDSLHYLHDSRYVHADIKAANILLPFSKAAKQPPVKTVYLVDFGLTAKYADSDGTHKPYKQDPKRAHDGTVEFTSRDAHMGVAPSRRGDMEILGYCLVQWLCGRLPWEDKLADKNYVADQKCKFMKDVPAAMKRCFPKGGDLTPAEVQKFLQHVDQLEYTEEPDYNQCKEFFKTFLRSRGIASEAPIDLAAGASASSTSSSAPGKRASKSSAASASAAANKSAPKSARASKSKTAARSSTDDDDDDEDDDRDDSMSTAFPPKRTPSKPTSKLGKGAKLNYQDQEEDEEDDADETVPLKEVKRGKGIGGSSSSSSNETAGRTKVTTAKAASAAKSASKSKKIAASSTAAISSSSLTVPISSSSTSSTTSSRSSRKRTKATDEVSEGDEDEEVEETEPLKEVLMNNSSEPRQKRPRIMQMRKNVKKTDSNTQTTPNRLKR